MFSDSTKERIRAQRDNAQEDLDSQVRIIFLKVSFLEPLHQDWIKSVQKVSKERINALTYPDWSLYKESRQMVRERKVTSRTSVSLDFPRVST